MSTQTERHNAIVDAINRSVYFTGTKGFWFKLPSMDPVADEMFHWAMFNSEDTVFSISTSSKDCLLFLFFMLAMNSTGDIE